MEAQSQMFPINKSNAAIKMETTMCELNHNVWRTKRLNYGPNYDQISLSPILIGFRISLKLPKLFSLLWLFCALDCSTVYLHHMEKKTAYVGVFFYCLVIFLIELSASFINQLQLNQSEGLPSL